MNVIIQIIVGIILFFLAGFVIKQYFSKTELQVDEKIGMFVIPAFLMGWLFLFFHTQYMNRYDSVLISYIFYNAVMIYSVKPLFRVLLLIDKENDFKSKLLHEPFKSSEVQKFNIEYQIIILLFNFIFFGLLFLSYHFENPYLLVVAKFSIVVATTFLIIRVIITLRRLGLFFLSTFINNPVLLFFVVVQTETLQIFNLLNWQGGLQWGVWLKDPGYPYNAIIFIFIIIFYVFVLDPIIKLRVKKGNKYIEERKRLNEIKRMSNINEISDRR